MTGDLPRTRGPVMHPGDQGFDGETSGQARWITGRTILADGGLT